MENNLNENPKTILSLEQWGVKQTWECNYSDTELDELIQAFYGLCVSATYDSDMVLNSLKEFAEERLNKSIEDSETEY